MQTNEFVFTGVIYKEEESFSSLCIELDVASEGKTLDTAAAALLEAVTLYLETAFEANLPYLRPLPTADDPRISNPESIVRVFDFKVDFQIKAYA